MKLQNQVCSVGQGKKLFFLGIELNSHFAWVSDIEGAPFKLVKANFKKEHEGGGYSAFTVSELGVMLPDCNYEGDFLLSSPNMGKDINGNDSIGFSIWNCFDKEDFKPEGFIVYPTEAQARAALLIYHLENKQVTPQEVNERLLNS